MLNILNVLFNFNLIHNVNEYLVDSSENEKNLLFFILYELHSFLPVFVPMVVPLPLTRYLFLGNQNKHLHMHSRFHNHRLAGQP